MLKKSCAIILSIALAMGILVHGSFAFTYGEEQSLDDFLSGLNNFTNTETVDNFWSWFNTSLQFVTAQGDGLSCVISYQTSWRGLEDFRIALFHGDYIFVSNEIFVDNLDPVYICWMSRDFLHTPSTSVSNPNVNNKYNFGFVDYYSSAAFIQQTNSSYYVLSSNDFTNIYNNTETFFYHNLDLGQYNPDDRFMDVSIFNGSTVPYLAVRVDDMPTSFAWVSVRFTDLYGNGTAIFDYFDMILYPGDDYQMYCVDPFDISSEEFTVTSVLFSGTTDWGTKEVDGLNLVFNEPILPDPIPSVTPVPDYNYFDTSIINYNGGQQDVFYNSFQVNLKRYEDSDNHKFFKDSFDYLEQPFAFNYILLPSFVVSQGFVYDDFVDDCFYQYDVIMTEYYDAYFDFFYGFGALSSLQSALNGLSSGTDISPYLDNWFAAHPPQVYTYPYSDDSSLIHLSSDMPALLVITDSFYFKQTNYLLGDTGDILSEFSERFYKVGGFSDSLFGNLSSLYNLNLEFYDNALPQLMNLSYFVNGLRVNEGFASVVQLLTSVDSYVSSVDGKLDYLVTIDSDLNDLLEWFQNQEDSDVTLTLPDFNPTILIDYYGDNIGDFVEFVQDFVNTLPEFDFSDFPNFFDYAADLVDDTAGSGDDLIGSLFSPYDYDDSGLHEFGWD